MVGILEQLSKFFLSLEVHSNTPCTVLLKSQMFRSSELFFRKNRYLSHAGLTTSFKNFNHFSNFRI